MAWSTEAGTSRQPGWRREAGAIRPLTLAVIVLVVLAAWLTTRYIKGAVQGPEFAQRVRSFVLDNPLAGDVELRGRIVAEAQARGIALDEASIEIERGGLTAMSGGGVRAVRMSYTVPIDMGLFELRKSYRTEVQP